MRGRRNTKRPRPQRAQLYGVFSKAMVLKSFEQARLRLHDRTNGRSLTLAGFEPTIGLVDDIGAPTATDHTVIPVPAFE
jgi:hypothetical protein